MCIGECEGNGGACVISAITALLGRCRPSGTIWILMAMIDLPVRQKPLSHRLAWPRLTLLALLLAAFALRLHELTRQDIWWDEARNIDVALRPFSQVANAPELDIHPPVYFWTLHMWLRTVGVAQGDDPVSIAFVARFLSVWAGVIGVGLLARLGSEAAHPMDGEALRAHVGAYLLDAPNWPAGVMAAAIGAFSPFWLAESQEARMYTLGFALLMGAAIALYRSARRPSQMAVSLAAALRSRSLWLTAFAGLAALSLLTHYNTVFVIAAWFAWWTALALTRRGGAMRVELGVVVATGLLASLLTLPALPIALRQIPGYANPNLGIPSIRDYLWQNWQAYVGGYAFRPDLPAGLGTGWLWAVAVVAVAGNIAYLVRRRGHADMSPARSRLWLLVFWAAGGLALYYIAVLDRGAFNVRYSSFVTPALYALIGVGLTGWPRRWMPLAAAGLALVFAGFAPAVRADIYDDSFAREDITGVTQWLRDHAGSSDVIFVDQKYPFGFYYDRYAIDANEEPVGREAAPARYLFVDINTIDDRLNEWAAEAERVFWVQWFESDTDPRRAVSFLLDQEGVRAGEELFHGYSIDVWELDPPTEYKLASDLTAIRRSWSPAVETVEASLPSRPEAGAPEARIRPGDEVPVVIRWQRVAGGQVQRPLKARVAVYDANGARVAQSDQRLLNDRHLLPSEWSMEDKPLNVYLLSLPDDMTPGLAEIRVLVYDADTLEALTLVDAAGNPVGQEALLGAIRVVEKE